MEVSMQRAPFGELVDFSIGGGWGKDTPFEGSLRVAVIRGTDFSRTSSGDLGQIPVRYEEEKKARKRLLRPGDILIEVSGGSPKSGQSTGRSLHISERLLQQFSVPVIPASFCRLVRVDTTKAEPLYVYYALQEMYKSGRARGYENQSTGISNFQFRYFTEAERVFLPPLGEQRAVASILGSLDDKIELNRRMNETLEEIARALFKSWFVDFDPVRAKMDGRQPAGMDDETTSLFPDRFQDSDIGKVPTGWGVGALAEYADLNPEFWAKNTAPDEITYVDLANTKWGNIEATQEYLWKDAPSRAQRVLRPGDTIVGTVRPGNGSFSLVTDEGLTGSTGFAVLRPRKAIYEEFVYLTATSPENVERLSRLADGAAYPAVRPDVVLATQIVQPSEPLIECFSHAVKPLMSRIAANRKEIRTLAAIRNTLLPKLLSGEIRVRGAGEVVEETA